MPLSLVLVANFPLFSSTALILILLLLAFIPHHQYTFSFHSFPHKSKLGHQFLRPIILNGSFVKGHSHSDGKRTAANFSSVLKNRVPLPMSITQYL